MHRADLDHRKHTAISSCSSVNTNIMSLLVLVRVVLFPFVDMVLDVVDRENRLIFLVEYIWHMPVHFVAIMDAAC
jgi:hypothetical protein